MKKVLIITCAYNSENTINRTIQSILSQSYSDFVYYVVNNGSTDHTGEIIKKLAKIDSRIVIINESKNNIGLLWEIIPNILACQEGTEYLCNIDADDTYSHDFLEKMIAFMEKEHLDIAACGNDFINAATGKLSGVRKLKSNLIIEGSKWGQYFQLYHQFMRTVWAKIYSLSVLLEDPFKPRYEIGYGGDTLFCLEAFRKANRVGIFAESLHQYYMIQKSASYQFNKKRIVSDQILFDSTRDFLIAKCGRVSQENLNYLFIVYLYSIRDTAKTLFDAKINVTEKLSHLCEIFQSQHTKELVQWPGLEPRFAVERSKVFNSIVNWLLSQKETRSGEGMELAAEILAAMRIYPSEIDGWHDCRVFSLLSKIKSKLPAAESSEKIDAQIVTIVSSMPSLAGLDAGFLTYFHDIVFSVLRHDEQKPVKQIKDILAKETDIPDEYAVPFLTLGLNLSAEQKQSDDFIYFKKLQISTLIALSKYEEALKQLADWDDVLPDDPDFKEYRLKLSI